MICAGLFTLVLFVVAVLSALYRRHAMRRLGLLWVLRTAVKRSVPLVPALEAYSRETSGYAGVQAMALVNMLRSGASLPDALEKAWGISDPELLPAVRVGYVAGALDESLELSAKTSPEQETLGAQTAGWMTLYAAIVPVMAASILVFVMLKIVPAFEKIFKDFGTALPPMTRALISACNFFAGSGLWIVCVLLICLACVWSVFAVLRYVGVPVRVPLLDRFIRRLDTARALEAMALSLGKGRPVSESLEILATRYPCGWLRRRLAGVFHSVEAGSDWCAALRRADIIGPSELAVVLAARQVGNLPWALAEIAEMQRRRTYRRMLWYSQIALPLFVAALAGVVATVVIGLFLPLISLIQKMV